MLPQDVPVLISLIPLMDELATKIKGYNVRIRKLNNELLKYCNGEFRFFCMDMSNDILDDEYNLYDQYHIGDRLLFSPAGTGL
jgi:hypothetical protein